MTEPPDDAAGRSRTTQLLVDLVLDPRDPAYQAAARRRGGTSTRRWYDRPLVVAGALVIGFLLAVAWVHTNRGAPQAAKVHDRLVQRARTAEQDAAALARTQSQLAAELDRARSAALRGSSRDVLRPLDRERLLAGSVAVHGQGVEVQLSEPTVTAQPSGLASAGARTPVSGGHILIDRDVRSVVNELWADGAEAIAVNDIRLTPTSAIRFAGDAVLVDLQPIASPYVIDAIGNADSLVTRFASSTVASRYQTLASARGIGFTFRDRPELTLSAAPETTPRYARAAR